MAMRMTLTSFIMARHLTTDEIELRQLAEEVMERRPVQGYLTISRAAVAPTVQASFRRLAKLPSALDLQGRTVNEAKKRKIEFGDFQTPSALRASFAKDCPC